MEPKPVSNQDPIISLHSLKNHQIDVGEFLYWADQNGYDLTPFSWGGTQGFRLSAITAFKDWVRKQVPKKFDNHIAAIKFMRQMVVDKRDGLKDCMDFVSAVARTPKPTNFAE